VPSALIATTNRISRSNLRTSWALHGRNSSSSTSSGADRRRPPRSRNIGRTSRSSTYACRVPRGLRCACTDCTDASARRVLTAYDQYAIEAFEADAIDYLLKPVAAERLARTVEKLRAQLAQPRPAGDLSALLAQLARQMEARPQPLRWFAPASAPETARSPSRSLWPTCSTSRPTISTTCVFARDGNTVREWLIRVPLAELAAQLDPVDFQQIHRSVIVNQHAVPGREGTCRQAARAHPRPRPGASVARQYAHLFQKM